MCKILTKKAITLVLALFFITGIQGCSYPALAISGASIATIGYISNKSLKKDSLTTLQAEASIDSAQTVVKNDSTEQKKDSQTEKASKGRVAFAVTMGIVTLLLPLVILGTLFQASPGLGD